MQSNGTILKLEEKEKYIPIIKKQAKGWSLYFSKNNKKVCTGLSFSENAKSIDVNFQGYDPNKIIFYDPISKEKIWALASKEEYFCFHDTYSKFGFKILPTFLGLVIKPEIDQLEIDASDMNLVKILMNKKFSSLDEDKKLYDIDTKSNFFNFDLERGYERAFIDEKRKIFGQMLHSASEQEKIKKHLFYIKFLLSFGLSSNAESELDDFKKRHPDNAQNQNFLAMRGMFFLLQNNFSKAIEVLSSPIIKERYDIKYYLQLANILDGNNLTEYAIKDFPLIGNVLSQENQSKYNYLEVLSSYNVGIFDTNKEILPEDLSLEAHYLRVQIYWSSKN